MDDELKLHKAYCLGSDFALIGLIGALIETHPRKDVLATALEAQKQYLLVTLTESNMPDHGLDAFHATWDRAVLRIPPAPRT